MRTGTFSLIAGFAADNSTLDPKMLDSVTIPLSAAAGTPIGPVATSISNAIGRTASRFNAGGQIRVVNFPGGGAARITGADINGPSGARATISGGSGVTFYWPRSLLRIDGTIDMGGGGLPTGRVVLHQPRPGGPLGGVADLAPYSAGGQRLALAPVRFGPGPGGSTAVSTLVQLDGPFPNGRVSALRLPVEGRLGPGGNFSVGTACAVVAFNYLQMSSLQLGPTRLPICPIGPAIISKHDGGPLLTSARLISPVVSGSLGSSPFHLAAANGQISGKELAFNSVGLRLGKSTNADLARRFKA